MISEALTISRQPSSLAARAKALLQVAAGILILVPFLASLRAMRAAHLVDSGLEGWAMWGVFTIHMWTRPCRKECFTTCVLGLVFRAAYDLAIGEQGYEGSLLIGMGTFLGAASLVVLATRTLLARGERRAVSRRTLGVVALLTYIGVCLGFYLSLARLVLPEKYDYSLYAFDGTLGFEPSFAAAALIRPIAPLYWILVRVYNSLGFWFSLIYAVHAGSRQKYRLDIVRLLVANPLVGFSLYFLCPAMGPKYAFPSFPALPGRIDPGAALLSGTPNAMPSLHFASALLILWLARPWKWLRLLTGAFAVLTALATLASGEHYLVDLVVAVPYAVVILAAAAQVPQRKFPLFSGAFLVLVWLWVLHSGAMQPATSWGLVVVTVATGFVLERRLARHLWAPVDPPVHQSTRIAPQPPVSALCQ